jgi:hypothetical protein
MRYCGTAGIILAAAVLVGCPAPKDAISVSNTSYDFGSNRQPWNFEVWNSNPSVSSLSFAVTPSETWIQCGPSSAVSTGPADVKVITVSVTRVGLTQGVHNGFITLSASGIKSKTVNISLYSDGLEGATGKDLNIADVSSTYSAPYLLDFTFSLRDRNNRPVIGEPNQFKLSCFENGVPISPEENPPRLAKASDKQPLYFLVLDYTASMASIQAHGDADHNGRSDAIDTMESSVKTVFLPALSADALVGVYEFHREMSPQKVCSLSADKNFVSQRIDAIWAQFVNFFWGPSRVWDAVYDAVQEFDPQNQNDENRNVIFVSDGRDTSSYRSKEDVVDAAKRLGVRIYCVGFGTDLDVATLQSVTQQTNGTFYAAATVQGLEAGFQDIVASLDGQYTLRWATLKRTDVAFVPSFLLRIAGNSDLYTAPTSYAVSDYADDELVGVLRIVPSMSGAQTTYFLRASYVPRYIWNLHLYVATPYAFTVAKVEASDGGLCGAWSLSTETDSVRGGTWISLESPNVGSIDTPIPFAAFGPMVRFEFNEVFGDDVTPFDVFYVDNTLYGGGQILTVQDYNNVLPGA